MCCLETLKTMLLSTSIGLSFCLKDDRDKKPRLTFMSPILSVQNRKEIGSKPAFDLYSNEKYTGEIGFLFHFREWISWWQIVLYHLVALISSSERQELFFITKTQRNFYTSSPWNAMTISISFPMFKQYPPRPFKTFFTRFNLHMKGNNISKEFFKKNNKRKSLHYIPYVNKLC